MDGDVHYYAFLMAPSCIDSMDIGLIEEVLRKLCCISVHKKTFPYPDFLTNNRLAPSRKLEDDPLYPPQYA